jgi:D-alanyl-D-alanine carboxypeptidase (penicillin-binding protein 5/6)
MGPWSKRGAPAPLLLALLAVFLVLSIVPVPALAATGGGGSAPDVGGTAVMLMDVDSGRIIYERNADERLSIASTTKIMTGVVVLENLSLEETVTVSAHAAGAGESEAWLETGEVLPAKTLFDAMMVRSANDAAVALAEAVAGSEEAFVELMNARAEELGLDNTHFANTHGLDAKGHYSSARDLAELTSYAMGLVPFRQAVASPKVTLPPAPSNGNPRTFSNRNKLIGEVDFITGVKTGYTGKAGWCLVGSGSDNGVDLVSVILGEPTQDERNNDTVELLEYGFSKYRQEVLVGQGEELAEVPVPYHFGETLSLSTDRRLVRTLYEDEKVTRTISVVRDVALPIEAGQTLGKVAFSVDGRPAGEVDLVAVRAVEAPTLRIKIQYLWDRFVAWADEQV